MLVKELEAEKEELEVKIRTTKLNGPRTTVCADLTLFHQPLFTQALACYAIFLVTIDRDVI